MKPVLIIAITMMTFAGCKSSEPKAKAQKINFTPEQAQNITASNQFGLALFKEINSNFNHHEKSNGNSCYWRNRLHWFSYSH